MLLGPAEMAEQKGRLSRLRSDILRLNEKFRCVDISADDYRLKISKLLIDYRNTELILLQNGGEDIFAKCITQFKKDSSEKRNV